MTGHVLQLSEKMKLTLWAHLLPPYTRQEQAAFLFCEATPHVGQTAYSALDVRLLSQSDFAFQAGDYLELGEAAQNEVIMHAHKLGACLAEFHSHPGPFPAAFSWSDRQGLRETVPHMRWRLKRRPYLAVVVAPSGFDALVFDDESGEPQPLNGIRVGDTHHTPTNHSLETWHDEYKQPL